MNPGLYSASFNRYGSIIREKHMMIEIKPISNEKANAFLGFWKEKPSNRPTKNGVVARIIKPRAEPNRLQGSS